MFNNHSHRLRVVYFIIIMEDNLFKVEILLRIKEYVQLKINKIR